jgi:hypothetical protein
MYGYSNEDAAWQRLIDIQREMENSQIWATESSNLFRLAARLAERVWLLGGLATRRAPRRRRTTSGV